MTKMISRNELGGLFVLPLFVMIVCAGASPCGAEPAAGPARVYHFRGSPEEIGRQHARALGPKIRQLHDRFFDQYIPDPNLRSLALSVAHGFRRKMLPEHLAEVRALSAAAEMDFRQMMLAQCFLDISAMAACSTVALPAEASPDGVARMGRNLDFPGLDVAENETDLLVFHPKGRHAFVAVSWPGLIGVLSGMNEHGLTLANMEVRRDRGLPIGMPYTLLYRTVLEQCRTVAEAVKLLEKTPRQTANNLMLMDAGGDRAVVEITPEGVTVRRAEAGAPLVSTNHHRGPDADSEGRCERYDLLIRESKRQFGQIDTGSIRSMLAETALAGMNLQAMVFEPKERVIHLSAGPRAAEGTYHRVDLKLLFAEGAGAAP